MVTKEHLQRENDLLKDLEWIVMGSSKHVCTEDCREHLGFCGREGTWVCKHCSRANFPEVKVCIRCSRPKPPLKVKLYCDNPACLSHHIANRNGD